jgi:hypothetical protein
MTSRVCVIGGVLFRLPAGSSGVVGVKRTSKKKAVEVKAQKDAERTSLRPRHSVIVPVGAIYDTAASLLRNPDNLGSGGDDDDDDDDAASLNGDEHLYADSEPPTADELQELNNAVMMVAVKENVKHRQDLLLLTSLLQCSEQLAVRVDGRGEGVECAVCIETMSSSEAYRELPCGHKFHRDCVDPWLQQSVTCPMCATSIVETVSTADLKVARDTPHVECAKQASTSHRRVTAM